MTQVLLYSGGMDSFITAHMFPEAKLLHIGLGTRYSKKEVRAVSQHNGPGPNGRAVKVDVRLFLGDREGSDAMIANRNLFLVLIGAMYGDEILLGATAGDLSNDKDSTWAAMTTELLRYMQLDAHYDGSPLHTVTLPVKHMTKGGLVKWLIDNEPESVVKEMVNSISCYSGDVIHCGVCKSCMRKWTALEANGLIFDGWHQHPSTANWRPVIEDMKRGVWRHEVEDHYTLQVLKNYGVLI